MPSGAKKRKAAKKKQENKPSTSKTTTDKSVGDENLKHHESEADRNSEQHLSEGEEEEVVEKRDEEVSVGEGGKSVSGVENESGGEIRLAEEEGGVQIQRELEPGEKFDNKGGSSSGSSSSSSSCSSDDEAPAVEKDIMVVENAPVVPAVESLSEGLIQENHTTQVNKIDNSVSKAASDVHVEKVLALEQDEAEGSSVLADNSLISDAVKSELKENGKRKLSEDSSAPTDNSLASDAVKSELKENGERKSSSLEESSRVIELVNDMAPEHKKDEVSNAAASSVSVHDSENKSGPSNDVTKDGEPVKDSEALGSSTGEPLIASGPRPLQTISWKSCCGLFEVFTGSSR